MLNSAKLMAFAATTDGDWAKAFYGGMLGLRLISDEGFAVVFDANGTQLRVQKMKEIHPPPFTVLRWEVDDIEAAITTLSARGVSFEHFDGAPQDDLGVWTAGDETKVAWFKDPDGNILSVTPFP